MKPARVVTIAALATAGAAALGASASSCATTPPNVPVRTFERAQKVDVVCLRVNQADGTPLDFADIRALPQGECAPVPALANGAALPNHLYATVTQTTRGELAVVDLTAGGVVDEDRSTPGINFIPVGVNPTDVVTASDAQMVFVSSADPNHMAIYGIPSVRLLGDQQGPAPLRLTDLPACALPQPPQALAMAAAANAPGYVVVAMLRAWAGMPARIVTVDPTPMLGAAPAGAFAPCSIVGVTGLATKLPASWAAGAAWPDGVPYADAGDLRDAEPSLGAQCASASDAGAADASHPMAFGPLDDPRPTSMAIRDDVRVLYVGDDALPIIHVVDLSNPASPRELEPLLATSVAEPARRVSVGAIAISPSTSAFARWLYAVDSKDGSLMVYDVTDPAKSPRTPLVRPHPELAPLQPVDRLRFVAPVATVAFVQHDWPYTIFDDAGASHAYEGVVCNPNPNVASTDKGYAYRADQVGRIQTNAIVENLPARLRGVFAFATLSNGTIVAIDVDDRDAPCRRPDPMDGTHATGSLDLPEPPPASGDDRDPYHAPSAGSAVTSEDFFPVSAPHRPRSNFLLRDDPTTGLHIPNAVGTPQLFDATGAPVSTSGAEAVSKPFLAATQLPAGFVDPSTNPPASSSPTAGALPSVRVSFDDPTVHVNQDWTITYEGTLPTVRGVSAHWQTSDGYRTLQLTAGGAGFCRRGIEDYRVGQARAKAALASMSAQPPDLARWTADYVEITDDLLDPSDPYWGLHGDDDECWDPRLASAGDRYDACNQTFGASGSSADQFLARDFPILEAYDDRLVVGRFGWQPQDGQGNPVSESTTNRVVVSADDGNAPFLKMARCCFHHQASFKARAGGEWLAVGANNIGMLHHVRADASGACVLSCDPNDALLASRAFDVPRAPANDCTKLVAAPDRNSPLAMRNPFFSFVVWSGCAPAFPGFGDHTLTTRDMIWKSSLSGGFVPVTVPLTGNTTSAVSPQSMRFIDSLGQLAVVDGSSQGLVLIDLNTVAFAHAPYF